MLCCSKICRIIICCVSIICLYSFFEIESSLVSIIWFPESCSLSSTCSVVKCSSKRWRLYNTYCAPFLLIVIRSCSKSCPLVVVKLVIYHAGIFAPCWLVSLNNHICHPVKFNSSFIKNIRYIIVCFRNYYCTRIIVKLTAVFSENCSFIHVLECPYCDTAVYNVLTVVTGIVPAAVCSNL